MRHRRRIRHRGALPLWLAGLLLSLCLGGAATALAQSQATIPPEMEQRAAAVFQRFVDALQAEFPELQDYTIGVVQERVANAWINQNHEITVTTGLLTLLDTDDQLAGVIGHEIAHGLLGHIPHRINQSLWSAVAVVTIGVLSNTEGKADWGGLWEMRELFMYAYSREQESEADVLGMRLAVRAGYEAMGLVEALSRMDDQRRSLPANSIWQELYRTHPSISQRVNELHFLLATEALAQVPLRSAGLVSTEDVAASPEEAARRFAQALWSGNREALEPLLAPGLADAADNWLAEQGEGLDAAWAGAELEVAERQVQAFDEVLTVRLWRPLPDASLEESTPAMALTLRRSARGWLVGGWQVVGESMVLTPSH